MQWPRSVEELQIGSSIIALIGLTQLDTRCGAPCQTQEDLIAVFSAIEAEAELVQAGLKQRAAAVIGSHQKRFQMLMALYSQCNTISE